ncbi:hypothetical protein PENARI_c013G04397 [Penicillium arizonense]|uniref:Uncharacterized protein n=1 Tax=Penicillium arizonense TaxID=1835702 RepID=A0A1F5LDS7_PENAI|nr:hypothetical protein PENARI_c013G04397 [Penicillium arizonense]OGE51362.1 hypothetical protein PENARI_c013G04397 [Penicillium arizonense]
MQESWIALIISCVSLGVTVAGLLLPVKEWLHYWFPRLLPQSDQNDVRPPANPESGGVVNTEAPERDYVLKTLASLTRRVEHLEAICLVERIKTLDSPTPSGSGGGKDAQHAVIGGTDKDGKAQGKKVDRSHLLGDEIG